MRGAGILGLVAGAVLLTGCDAGEPSALACKIEVDTPSLVKDREAAGIADCSGIATSPDALALPALELRCLGGTSTLSLSDVQGPAMINFWASNCGPCRDELPALQEFHETHGDRVAVLGVDFLDTQPEMAIDLARLSGVTYPSLADSCGDLQETDMLLPRGLPFFLFVGADGSVSAPHAGGLDTVQEVTALVEEQLGIDLADPESAPR